MSTVPPSFLTSRRSVPLLFAVLLAMFLLAACAQPPATPTPTSTPTPAQPQPTATQAPSATEAGSTTLIQGRPYLKATVPGAAIYYESGVSDQVVLVFQQVYALTMGVVKKEFAISDMAPMEVYISSDAQFQLFAQANDFSHPSYLAGFYSYNVRDGRAVDAKVYLNAEAQDIVPNMAHELTHVATPWLPAWISEGVANHVGFQVGFTADPYQGEVRTLRARKTLRDALQSNSFLFWDELRSFDWVASSDYTKLDLAYNESWQLMDYIANHYAPDGLRNLVDLYRHDVPDGEDPFQTSLGVSAATLWQAFSDDITKALTSEEEVGLSLCVLGQIATQGAAVTNDWNQLVSQAGPLLAGAGPEQFRSFGVRWKALAAQTGQTDAPGQAVIVRNLWLAYFQNMASATDALVAGDASTATTRLASASQRLSLATFSLQGAMTGRPWLTCD